MPAEPLAAGIGASGSHATHSRPDFVPEIGTRAVMTFFLYFERSFGRERLLQAIARIGEPDWTYLQDSENFVSFAYVQRVANTLTDDSGDPAFLRRAGEHQLDDPRSLGFAYYLARSLGSPRLYYWMAVKTASTFNRVGDVSLEELGDRRAVLRYCSRKPEENRLICEGRLGQLAAAPKLWGLPLAQARELECQVLGAPACRYELTWLPLQRPLLRAAVGAGAGFAAGGLAWGLRGALCGAALAALAALVVSYRALARARADHIMDSAEASARAMQELQRRFEQAQALHARAQAAHRSLEQEMERRQRAEAALVESQKLEAIGRLSGGIAHDFNNLLTVILHAAEAGKKRAHLPAEVSAQLDAVSSAATRAADLIRRLLAFARQQVVEPRVIDVGRQLRELEPMLRSLVGERIEVVLELDSSADALEVLIDPTQLEQVLMNLAANARDAMPDGGTLRFELGARTLSAADGGLADILGAGDYALLTVRDSGCGMDEATRRRAFEPFFTTKEVGKGTGLGLATCHGIVHQAGGTVTIESAPGLGTAVKVHLPRVRDQRRVST